MFGIDLQEFGGGGNFLIVSRESVVDELADIFCGGLAHIHVSYVHC